MEPPILMTQRLVIKTISCSDAPLLFAYRTDPAINRYQTWKPRTMTEALEFIQKSSRAFNSGGSWFQLGIYEKGNLTLIGDIGLHFLAADESQVEIGFTIAGPYQRKGYGREAVRSVIGYLFGAMNKHRIIASVDPRNAASIALLESIKLRREGYFRKSVRVADHWEDDVVYAVLEEEWPG